MRAPIPERVAARIARLRDAVTPARIAGKLARVLLAGFLLCHAALFLLVFFASLVLSRVNPPVTALMIYRRLTAQQKARPVTFVALRQIPQQARDMVVRLEDYGFYRHAGIDLGAIRDAYLINRSIGRAAVGGSTIPQQLARNLFLTPRKTYVRKYIEALAAVEMDLVLPKSRILELYLNCIEWGKGVYGIGAASAYYYGRGVGNLSVDQMRRLITIITNPLRYDVNTWYKSRQMAERYAYLVSKFPDPAAPPEAAPPEATPPPPG